MVYWSGVDIIITGFHPNHPLDAAGSFPAPLRSESTIKHALATGEAKDLGEVALQSRLCRPRWWCVVPFFGGMVFVRQENEWKWEVWGIETCQNNLKHKRTTQHLRGCLALKFEPMQMVAVCCPETIRDLGLWYSTLKVLHYAFMPMCVHRLMSNFRSFELIRSYGAIQRKRPDLIQG